MSSIVEPGEHGHALNAILDPRLNGRDEEIARLPTMPMIVRRGLLAFKALLLVFAIAVVARMTGLLSEELVDTVEILVEDAWILLLAATFGIPWLENRYRDTHRPRR